MDDFQIIRRGDQITLAFSVFVDRGKAEFNLVGPKPAFYRMAMGVSLMETLQEVTAHDPKLDGAEALADKENVTFTIKTRNDTPEPAKVELRPPSREQEVNRAYAVALESNDPAKLLAFAAAYPDTSKAPMAKKLADRLMSDKEYEKLGPSADLSALKDFLVRYPASRFKDAITTRIADLSRQEVARAAEESKRRAEAEAEKQRKIEEEEAKRARQADEKRLAEQQKRERDAFNRARGNLDALRAFVAEHPDSAQVAEAEGLIAKIQREQEEEARANGGKQKLIARYAAKPPTVDGDGSDAAWSAATPVTVELEPQSRKAPKTSLEVRALINGDTIYLRLRWRDPSEDAQYRPWLWDAAKGKYSQAELLDDAVAVSLRPEKGGEDSCMLSGQPQKTDVWLWRAFWSGISGKASDQMIITSRDRLPKSNPYLSRYGKGQVWLQNLPDKGKQAWRYDIPLSNANPVRSLPSYVADAPSGSAGDVSARGRYRDGGWTVEFTRQLDTGNDDDVSIPKSGKMMVSFAVYEKADRNDHASSPLVILETQGR